MKTLAIILGIIFVIAAILSATGALHVSHTLGFDGRHHTKHTILYAVLAVLSFVWARMTPGVSASR